MDNKQVRQVIISDKEISLSPDLFVGRGRHKECYRYPGNSELCIKIPYNEEGISDLNCEIDYLNRISGKNLDYSVLPAYYVPVKTNKGEGHVYEFITNYDKSACLTVKDILRDTALLEKYYDQLIEKLKLLHQTLLDNLIITMGLFPENIIVQYVAPDETKLRLVNDIGCTTFIRLSYYFEFFAKRHIEKRWQRFSKNLIDRHYSGRYPSPLVAELGKKIR